MMNGGNVSVLTSTRTRYGGRRHQHCRSVMMKMWELRSQNQFCDIDIKIDERVFHCHRNILSATSEYFQVMFGGSFLESTAKEVTLHGVDVSTFESILFFMYTGEVDIDIYNAFDLIHAARFYGLALLEENLIDFARRVSRSLSAEDIVEMFTSAHLAGMRGLSKFLSECMSKDFGYISDRPEFINFTWDMLMESAGLASNVREAALSDTIVEGILKWIRGQVNASASERSSYLKQLVQILSQTESFRSYIQHVLDQCADEEQALKNDTVDVLDTRPPKLLRAFVTKPRGSTIRPRFSRMFTLYETNAGLAWAYSGELTIANDSMRSIFIDDSLYTLSPGRTSSHGAQLICHRPAFTGAPHISMCQRQRLREPPYITDSFDICGVNNNIFTYSKMVHHLEFFYKGTYPDFTADEVHRGVLLYKRDVDKWFPLPPPWKFPNSCITCDERRVYLIGGRKSYGGVQCYDLRAPAWMELPRTTGIYENAACCIQDGKIWVAGGEMNSTNVEIFDPIAGTWERGKDLIRTRPYDSRLINWNSVHHGHTVVSFRNSSHTDHEILFADDSDPSGWDVAPDLRLASKGSTLPLTLNDLLRDVVVF